MKEGRRKEYKAHMGGELESCRTSQVRTKKRAEGALVSMQRGEKAEKSTRGRGTDGEAEQAYRGRVGELRVEGVEQLLGRDVTVAIHIGLKRHSRTRHERVHSSTKQKRRVS